MRNLINTLWDEWKMVEQQIEELGEESERTSLPMPAVRASGRLSAPRGNRNPERRIRLRRILR